MYIHIHTHIHSHTYTHIHTYTHVQERRRNLPDEDKDTSTGIEGWADQLQKARENACIGFFALLWILGLLVH